MSNINEQLKKCYLNRWPVLKSEIKKLKGYENFEHPHLLSVSTPFEQEWQKADIRLMIFGISTNGWDAEEDIYEAGDEAAIKSLMELYEKFYFRGGNWRYGQVFWNYFYAIRELLQYRLNKSISVIWNNVYKFSKEQGTFEGEYFNLAEEEINIFQPNVILVLGTDAGTALHSRLSGENIDWVAKEVWNEDDTENKKFLYYDLEGEVYPKIKDFVKRTFITYHPNARGGAGIKMKLMLDELYTQLKNI